MASRRLRCMRAACAAGAAVVALAAAPPAFAATSKTLVRCTPLPLTALCLFVVGGSAFGYADRLRVYRHAGM